MTDTTDRTREANSPKNGEIRAQSEGDWRESDVVKKARRMLADGVSPRFAESDYEEVLRGVLAERDFIGDWLQRYIDADYYAGQEGGGTA